VNHDEDPKRGAQAEQHEPLLFVSCLRILEKQRLLVEKTD